MTKDLPSDVSAAAALSMPRLYLSVGLLAGAVIALQIAIMRVFSVGSWAHFGSLVVSLALLGFGLSSVGVFIAKGWLERHWRGAGGVALASFGPLAVASNLVAQTVPFNAIFLVSDPNQVWRLAANFVLYLLPFLGGRVAEVHPAAERADGVDGAKLALLERASDPIPVHAGKYF